MTDTAWYGITPEPIATIIATHLSAISPPGKKIVIDAFAGAGGNTIAFALSGRWNQIFAIEKDPDTLKCAKHNAEIYGVAKKIFWIEGDCFELMKGRLKSTAKNAVIFASPPWGGQGYRNEKIFDLSLMEPYNLRILWDAFRARSNCFVLYLPRQSDLNQVAACIEGDRTEDDDAKTQVMHYCALGASKVNTLGALPHCSTGGLTSPQALCVYAGDFGRL